MAETKKRESSIERAPLDEEEEPINSDPLADYEDFADPGDSNPDDRRRDPLRH
jgi:hypothetical protein